MIETDIAVCTCGRLLIFTLYFQQYQWLCMGCGMAWQKPPRRQPSTPEGELKWRALEAEFMVNCGSKLIVQGLLREGCAKCDQDEPHLFHATRDDWQQCNDALYWLSERTGREFRLVNGVIQAQ